MQTPSGDALDRFSRAGRVIDKSFGVSFERGIASVIRERQHFSKHHSVLAILKLKHYRKAESPCDNLSTIQQNQ